MKKYFYTLVLLLWYQKSNAQKNIQKVKVGIVAFYNLENLYDTQHNTLVDDLSFTAEGEKHYNKALYQNKLFHLATVIKGIGESVSTDGAALIGVVEIENDTVLKDLVRHPLLRKRDYQVIHYNSKDKRGIDVALLYNPTYFKALESESIHVSLPYSGSNTYETRDILCVKGLLDGEPIYVFVNHWPSKRGGEERTAISRATAAATCRKVINRIIANDTNAKILVMGDMNDNPDSYSVSKILKAEADATMLTEGALYNPWWQLYKKGIGTLANQDSWSLFDQIILSQSWLNKEQVGFYYHSNHIYKKGFMLENSGRYKGYPMRTWDGNNYRGGYSDHFPTYIVVIKRVI